MLVDAPGGVLPILRYTCMCRANAPVFGHFSLSVRRKKFVFSLCASIKPDNSLFHQGENFPIKTFRRGLPCTLLEKFFNNYLLVTLNFLISLSPCAPWALVAHPHRFGMAVTNHKVMLQSLSQDAGVVQHAMKYFVIPE